ncbi:MAG: AP2 domain-containing protein [Candidatus Thiothrix putei]|uniref:AP2 domain-containing protein n=1 Tax=Candidatus Thiothrix putei TaxID=3080811 RepID=A0AA95KMJ7_9GAMM|nr:MAG: AP2 domain-containing protein [Candidatus Thiothrix putei]
MYKTNLPNQEFLKSLFDYDAELGVLRWKESRRGTVKVGAIAGCINKSTGYRVITITINGRAKSFLASRLIYKWHKGIAPNIIDHRDQIRSNDKIENLRNTTSAGNNRNKKKSSRNTSGFTGVHWDKAKNKWQAQIMLNGKQKHLGYFDDILEAAQAYKNAQAELNAELPKHERFSQRHGKIRTELRFDLQ